MLREHTSNYPEKSGRKWFSDDYFDLIVWFADNQTITGFQLCYDKGAKERAITWRCDKGFSHERVDDGEANPAKNLSPILVPDGTCPIDEIIGLFLTASAGMEFEVRQCIAAKLRQFGAAGKI